MEQLALEPMVGEADRAVLMNYGAGFTWRLHELRAKMYGVPAGATSAPGAASQPPPATRASAQLSESPPTAVTVLGAMSLGGGVGEGSVAPEPPASPTPQLLLPERVPPAVL